jgi:hypothetical protein
MQNNTTEELTLDEAKQIISELRDRLQKMPDPKSIGYQIKKRRVAAGVTHEKMHQEGVFGICNIERLNRAITTTTLKKIANSLGCKAWQIVKDWEDASNPACELASADDTRADENRPSA